MIQAEHIDGVCQLGISGELTIYTAKECRQHLLQNLVRCRAMEIDLSRVTEIDSAGLQLLIQVQREESVRGVPTRLGPLSEPVVDVLRMLGLGVSDGVLSICAADKEGDA